MPNLPMQPIENRRFVENTLVSHLLDFATPRGCGMNELASVPCTPEERMQFAQLIGYSLSGYGELSYVDNDSCAQAENAARNPALTPDQARIKALEETLYVIRLRLRDAAVAAFRVHPDDLLLDREEVPDVPNEEET